MGDEGIGTSGAMRSRYWSISETGSDGTATKHLFGDVFLTSLSLILKGNNIVPLLGSYFASTSHCDPQMSS